MKKALGLILVLTLATVGISFAWAPQQPSKEVPNPPCGVCWDQTFNASSLSCSGSARDCSNCTVCG